MTAVQKFRKRDIEAMRWDGTTDSTDAILKWMAMPNLVVSATDHLEILQHGGATRMAVGDYLVKVHDGFRPWESAIFAATHEAVPIAPEVHLNPAAAPFSWRGK